MKVTGKVRTVTKTFEFEASHKLPPPYEGKCSQNHGHSYKLEVTLFGEIDPSNGMILDFSKLKKIVNDEIIEILDHSYVNDFIPNPTAEVISDWVWNRLEKAGLTNIFSIRLWETSSSYTDILGIFEE